MDFLLWTPFHMKSLELQAFGFFYLISYFFYSLNYTNHSSSIGTSTNAAGPWLIDWIF